ncbi:HlyD family efflux transporter periplasmic adaptor subunit [Pararhodobacter sp. SW119]|uniref:efflux RND transporter periplasmic adaptor subunit n=1 Tax=Pararhodobacter sp. SW119 TaxID=2780075 RepID=UPI001ADFED09|nr:HlyD family efflux transporter periplasmic adaptor subunit [Pararhodobacter sp. SW119]
MRFLSRSLIAVFLAAMTLGLLGLAGLIVQGAFSDRAAQDAPERTARERIFTARVVTIQPGEIAPDLVAYGEVRARRTLEMRAPFAGRVIEIAQGVEDGAAVTAGQVLIRLDPADAESVRDLAGADLRRAEADLRDAARSLDLARADVAEAQAQADLRRRAFERRRTLSERGVGTEAAIEEAELAFAASRAAVIARFQAEAQAEARLEAAETTLERQRINLAEAERRLAETAITAGFTGVLSDVTVVAGGLVGSNERLAQLIDPDALEVAFRLSTAQYLRLLDDDGNLIDSAGQATIDLGGQTITSPIRLVRASPAVGEGQTGRLLYAELQAPRGFRPGDFVTVRVAEPPLQGVALVPATAVDANGGVLVLGAGDRLETGQVDLLRRQDDMVLIRAHGLNGQEVVTARTPLLGAGIRIRPERDETGEARAPAPMVALNTARRAALVARVTENATLPDPVRSRILNQLEAESVPAQLIERLEQGHQGG